MKTTDVAVIAALPPDSQVNRTELPMIVVRTRDPQMETTDVAVIAALPPDSQVNTTELPMTVVLTRDLPMIDLPVVKVMVAAMVTAQQMDMRAPA
ncbi:hypothetical protein G8764_10640 [Pseudomaricurvus alcaniphilus]|uniref:hypothetical protein n=1 Tax=Pseudomaricurvus alcaniphilus TaxID=1166482 RepID=UPI00140C6C51|nr:hypothetical protein [Pseudomaricurvus alcaniphilus]NHN37753.1 hypothetical protein [Pseudomaricurvus alcaniphilus]